ncbi:MAG: elongation factor Ts [Bacteroidetes bacterium]|nr:elongation factor Ts [Bacteroidota bacterium]
MEIKAADVAKLRKMTGAGLMDCKKALVEAEGDFSKAKDIIREKGKLIANKRADRDAAEGIMVSQIIGNKGYILCLACETDFVAKNESFEENTNNFLKIAIENDSADLKALLATDVKGQTVQEMATALSGTIGEKIEIPFYARVEAPMIGSYIHMNKKLGTLVGFSCEIDKDVAHDVAMQATAMAPIAIDKCDVPAEVLAKELEIGMQQAREEGKPEAILEKIGNGKVNKFIKENTLMNQALVKNNKMTVAEFIHNENADVKINAYERYSLND